MSDIKITASDQTATNKELTRSEVTDEIQTDLDRPGRAKIPESKSESDQPGRAKEPDNPDCDMFIGVNMIAFKQDDQWNFAPQLRLRYNHDFIDSKIPIDILDVPIGGYLEAGVGSNLSYLTTNVAFPIVLGESKFIHFAVVPRLRADYHYHKKEFSFLGEIGLRLGVKLAKNISPVIEYSPALLDIGGKNKGMDHAGTLSIGLEWYF